MRQTNVKNPKFRFSTPFVLAVALLGGGSAALLKAPPQQPRRVAAHPHAQPDATLPAVAETTSAEKPQVKAAQPAPAVNDAAPAAFTAVDRNAPSAEITFTETDDGVFEAATKIYRASVDADTGLTYRVRGEKPQDERGSLNISLRKASMGKTVLYDRSVDDDTDIAMDRGNDGIAFMRTPGFDECYKPRGDGVEQYFLLDSMPDGDGDLEIVCAVNAKDLTAVKTDGGYHGGIRFRDAAQKFAVRYGQVVVRDAAKSGVVVEPQLSADGRSISFAIPAAWLQDAKFPVVIDPLVGQDFVISPDNDEAFAGRPTIAAGNTNFLVAWTDYRAGLAAPQQFASLISQSGVTSQSFPISNAIGVPLRYRFQRTAAAFDGTSYLVVWTDERTSGAGVRGSIVNGATGVVLGGTDFLIASTTGALFEDPIVSFNGVDFIVAWHDTPPGNAGGSQIFYTQVTSGGIVGQQRVVAAANPQITQFSHFLSSDKLSGDTLLLYREAIDVPAQTRSTRIARDGTVRDPGGTALFTENIADNGLGRPIGVTFISNEWHILSSFDQRLDSSVFLHRLSTAGVLTPPAGVFAEVGVGPTNQAADGVPLDAYQPAFAGANEWLFIRNLKVSNTVFHLIGKRVTFDGVDKDTTMFQIDEATQGILSHSVAAQSGNLFLAAWLDGRRFNQQPIDAVNVFGALIDSTVPNAGSQALIPVISASPTSGEPPLTVSFDSSASTGLFDKLTWNFADGTTSTTANTTHEFRSRGTYSVQLQLTKGAYSVFDTVLIRVGAGNPISAPAIVGTPVTTSEGIVTDLVISGAIINLNFVNDTRDALAIRGVFDAASIPLQLIGTKATITVGSGATAFSQQFTLDANGQSTSTNAAFSLAQTNGFFGATIVNINLRAAMDALGAKNETVKPFAIVNIPISLTVGDKTVTATVGAQYKATKDASGVASYQFLGIGQEVSGAFLISSFTASEKGKVPLRTHDYTIKGQIIRPNGAPIAPDLAGNIRIQIANVGELSFPISQATIKKTKLTFKGAKNAIGIKQFQLDTKTGAFTVQLTKIAAEGATPDGLPLAKSGTNVVRVNLAFSMIIDMTAGETLSVGRYIFIGRANSATKAWKLR